MANKATKSKREGGSPATQRRGPPPLPAARPKQRREETGVHPTEAGKPQRRAATPPVKSGVQPSVEQPPATDAPISHETILHEIQRLERRHAELETALCGVMKEQSERMEHLESALKTTRRQMLGLVRKMQKMVEAQENHRDVLVELKRASGAED